MKKYLIVYYSRTGVSKKAAGRIYEFLSTKGETDIEEIIDMKNRRGFLGALSSARDALSDNITKIGPVKNPPSGYLEVIVVSPIWCGKIADAVRTYLAAYKADIKTFKLVLCGGSDSIKQGQVIQKYVLRAFALKTTTLLTLKSNNVKKGEIAIESIAADNENNKLET